MPNLDFLDGIVCFNHFLHQRDVLQEDDILYNLIARCAAARLKDGFNYFDLLIPVILKDGSVGSILIQVKNDKNASNRSHAVKMLQRKAFNSDSTDTRWDNDHCLKILMSLRKEKFQKPYFYERDTLIVSGLSESVYPCLSNNVSSELNKLINLQRSDVSSIDESAVTQTFQGSISRFK